MGAQRSHGAPHPGTVGRSAQKDPSRGAVQAALASLQRQAGNTALGLALQRNGPNADNIATLDELLDRWNTPEEDLIALLGRMSPAEKRTVITGYRGRLASVFNIDEMRRGVIALGPELPIKLDWIEQSAAMTSSIDYDDIRQLVRSAPQGERDMLKNGRWRKFFAQVCDNSTIVSAVSDLNFDLETKLRWIKEEASAQFSLDFATLKPVLAGAPEPQRATVATDSWRTFWTAVCTNATMPELVDLLFPQSLVKKLEWMADEGTDFAQIKSKVAQTKDASQKAAVFASATVRSLLVSAADDAEMIEFVLALGDDWSKWRDWVRAEGAQLLDLAVAAVKKGSISEPSVVAFIRLIQRGESASSTRIYLRDLSDPELATLRGSPIASDLINAEYGSNAGPVLSALNGEISSEERTVSLNETLLTGPTSSPFVAMDFGGDHRFNITYHRDRVDVSAGVELEAVDDRAEELLPGAIATWRSNIHGAWNNKFQITNGERTIPMRFHAHLGSGPNHVNVHSGVWVWPKLNAGNWFVPDPEKVPQQAAAVAQAPVHEFGHLIGNLDEYSVGAGHYIAVTGQNPATDPNAVPETDVAGTTRYTNTVSLMGSGTTVLRNHVRNILDWVNRNLRSGEPQFSFV